MNREEFIKKCALMGVGISVGGMFLSSCKKEEELNVNFSGKVLIIGAGASGMMAGYTCAQNGIDFEIIEASDRYGGRIKMTDSFANFPIDLGAEWIHTTPDIFRDLIGDESAEGSINLVPYKADTLYNWKDGELKKQNWASTFYGEYKFKDSTWFQFFENNIIPSIESQILLNRPVRSIDYSDEKVIVRDIHGNEYEADRVIVTVPLNILKEGSISFIPEFPSEKESALSKTNMPDGIKVFIKFSERFYPDITNVGAILGDDSERIYYDAAFKKDTTQNILGLFSAGEKAIKFAQLKSDSEIINAVLKELDEIFDGKATQYYQQAIVQNWSAEPYVKGAYTFGGLYYEDTIAKLSEPIESKVYFAGEALHTDYWATVHGAGLSGVEVANRVISDE